MLGLHLEVLFFALQIAFIGVVYPSLVLAYMGEAAYLSKHLEDVERSFYKAIPASIFWPFFVIATLATVVGSQAIITATFSIISQCRALGCFPRVKVIHTSSQIHGQIYIPEVNWLLMFLCLAVTIGFRDTNTIGNAYGLAVITVMFVTTCLMFLVIITVWKRNVLAALLFTVAFGSLELMYFVACLAKVHHGGWLPLMLSFITMLAMSIWHYGTTRKEAFEFQNKVDIDKILSLGPCLGLLRVPGVGFVYSDMISGVPPMFAHFVTNFPAFHRILIFVSMQTLTIPKIPLEERFLIGRIGPAEHRLFRCIVRYGYKDGRMTPYDFENQMFSKVAEFLQQEPANSDETSTISELSDTEKLKDVGVKEEVRELLQQREAGVSYMMGHTCIVAHESSSFIKKLAINGYGFLRRNCRQPSVTLGIPHTSLIEVGMLYHV